MTSFFFNLLNFRYYVNFVFTFNVFSGIISVMEELLQQAGLNEIQARAYLYLLKNGQSSPPAVAKALQLTRSNAYKILDKLTGMGLIRRTEAHKKYVYQAEDPIALASIVAAERNRLIALEKGVKSAIHELRQTYERTTASDVTTYRGKAAVISLYGEQTELKQPIRFIKSRADIPVMGFETMDKLRRLPAQRGILRYGITPDAPEASLNPAIDRRASLTRTWVDADDYTSPVEWSVCGDELLIVSFQDDASAIRIKDQVIAKSFRELWQLLDTSLRQNPGYKKLPRQARRKV